MVERVVDGKDRGLGSDRFLHVATVGVRDRKSAIGGMDRKDAVAVDELNIAPPLVDDPSIHVGMKEAWKVVGHDGARLLCEGLGQGMAVAATRFDIGQITGVARCDLARIVLHPVDNKLVKSVRCPGVTDSDSFENQERPLQLDSQFDRTLEGKVRVEPSERCHPIENEFSVRLDRFRGGGSDSRGRDCGLHGWSSKGFPGASAQCSGLKSDRRGRFDAEESRD